MREGSMVVADGEAVAMDPSYDDAAARERMASSTSCRARLAACRPIFGCWTFMLTRRHWISNTGRIIC